MKKNIIVISLILPMLLSSCSVKKQQVDKSVLSNTEIAAGKNESDKNSQERNESAKTQSGTSDPNKENKGSSETNNSTSKDTNKIEEPKAEEKTKNNEVKAPQVDISKLDTAERSWFFQPKNDGTPSGAPQDIINLINKYSGYYLGDTSKKYIYLTFDEGYENGYTPKILDTLKNNNVKAAFFVVSPYITSNKALVKRMADEGHLVANHSVNHPAMNTIKDQEKFNSELSGVEKLYEEVTGKKMAKFFRPPMGKYSEQSLYYTAAYGYKSIFWSFAYADWDPEKQPSHEDAKKQILQRTHNGAIILLHAVSKTNTEILDELIKEWKNSGYEFRSLEELH
jgi:peptidoglycan-N-acetylmuramic acid deacetylase